MDRIAGDRVVGDRERVAVRASRWDALPLAMAHCARYGRAAQYSHMEPNRAVYHCVVQRPATNVR